MLHGQSVGSLSTLPTGELLMTGFDESTPISWRSSDGVTWDRTPPQRRFDTMASWGEAFLGLGGSGPRADISISLDGIQWDELGLGELLSNDLSWSFDQLAAGEAGIAVVVTGTAKRVAPSTFEQFTVRGGTLTIIAARHDTGVLLSVHVVNSRGRLLMDEIPENMVVDFDAHTITLIEPDTRAEILTLTEVEAVQPDPVGSVGNDSTLLLVSQDGRQWSIQPIDVSEEGLDLVQLLVTDTEVVAAIGRFHDVDGRTIELSALEVWTADFG